MAPEAYVLITSEAGKEDDVLRDVRKKEGVVSVDEAFGNYDIIVKVEAGKQDELITRITGEKGIRSVYGIEKTLTLFCYAGFTRDEHGKPVDLKSDSK